MSGERLNEWNVWNLIWLLWLWFDAMRNYVHKIKIVVIENVVLPNKVFSKHITH